MTNKFFVSFLVASIISSPLQSAWALPAPAPEKTALDFNIDNSQASLPNDESCN